MKSIDWSTLFRGKRFWYIAAGCLAVGLAAAALLWQGSGITARSVTAEGVSPDTAFEIRAMGLDEKQLREQLRLEPETAYSLTKEQGYFLLQPLKPLEAGSNLVITLQGRTYPFRVRNTLLVSSHFPADGGRKVPVNSGIELKFNVGDLSLSDLEKAFAIEPPVEGRFTEGDGRFVFFPNDQYLYDTLYTVRLSPPLASAGGAALEEPVSFSFTTISQSAERTEYLFQLRGRSSYNTLSDELPLIQFYLDRQAQWPEDGRVSVALYAYDGWEDYREALLEYNRTTSYRNFSSPSIPVEELTPYATFDASLFPSYEGEGKGYSNLHVLQFPETPPPGWYAAEFTVECTGLDGANTVYTLTQQVFLQVSDVSVFSMESHGETLFWVNSAATGGPIDQAQVEVEGNVRGSGVTGSDGTCTLTLEQLDEESSGGVVAVSAGDEVFVDTLQFSALSSYDQQEIEANRYLAYLFTDRPIYRTSDTIQVWGMARPRSPEHPLPDNLTLSLYDGAVELPVTPGADGLFTAKLEYKNVTSSSWASLALKAGEVQLDSIYLSIEDFVKPIYTAQSAPERPVYLLSNPAADPAVSCLLTLFDGTPASSFPLNVESWSDASFPGGTELVTDADGRVRVPMAFSDYRTASTWYPKSYQYRIANNDAEAENFYHYGQIHVIHRDLMLRGRAVKNDPTKAEIFTNRIDITGIESPDELWDTDNIKGAALSQRVEVELHKIYYTKMETGTSYDFVNRAMKKSYRYERHDDVVAEYDVTTGPDGRYLLENLPRSDEEACYYLSLLATDSANMPVRYQVYLGMEWESYGSMDNIHRYGLQKQLDTPAPAIRENEDGYYFAGLYEQLYRFSDNETVSFQLTDNDQPVSEMPGRLLSVVVQDSYSHISLSDRPGLTLPFQEALLPNYVLTGAYFDGRHVFELQDKYMYFDPAQRELDIRLQTDKDAYRPADDAVVTATVTNRSTGRAVAGAELVLSVVDEAIFAIREQRPNLLSSLYESVYFPYIKKYTSYTQDGSMDGAEKGGGGGDEDMRVDFQDTAFFATARTGADGRASFQFKLPDNITSWRLTSLALTGDGQAGDNKGNLISTKPFFVNPIVSETILDGDSFTVGLRSAGVGVADGDGVSYTVTVTGPGGQRTSRVNSTVKGYASATFGGLGAGDYTVAIRGGSGSYTDGLELPFSVVESGIEVSMVKTFALRDGIQIDPLRYPVSLSIYDQTLKIYNRVFSNVFSNSYGQRADMRLANKHLAQLLEEEGAPRYLTDGIEADISDLTGNVISLFPYSEPDVELTAKAALALPDVVSARVLSGYTFQEAAQLEGAASAYYIARALNGELDAAEAARLLEQGGDLDFVDRMYLACALAVAGDETAAQSWYGKLVTPKLTQLQGLSGDIAYYLPAHGRRSQSDCTAAALMLATLLQLEDADGLALYLVERPSDYEPYLLEQLLYLERRAPAGQGGGRFSYTLNGQNVTEELGRQAVRLNLSEEQLAKADFQVLSGEVYADVYYSGAPQETADESRRLIGVTKTVEPLDGGFTRGSMVKITITPDFTLLDTDIGSASLVIDDYIPTGMRFERYGDQHRASSLSQWSLSSRQEQRLRFSAWGDGNLSRVPIVYYARCSAPGEYVVESAYISSREGDVWGASDRSTVTIR